VGVGRAGIGFDVAGRGGVGRSGWPGAARLPGRARPSEPLLVVAAAAGVAQDLVRLAEPDEHGLELVAQVAERLAVVGVRVEALGQAEVRVLHVRLGRGARDAQDLVVVPRLQGLERAEELYEKVFFEYGDDSVAQLGGVHLACEQASNLLTKVLEWGG